VITYGEYTKHYPDKKRPLLLAGRTAVAVFVFFMLAALAVSLLATRL
jgi:hypothetical protein